MSSFTSFDNEIRPNDTVIIYISFNHLIPLKVTKTKLNKLGDEIEHILQTQYGGLKIWDLVGKKFGSKVRMSKGGYVYVLKPTPELWTKALPHRTQILYSTDISMIILQLGLCPGSIVVESGTGSGSLSHAIARTIMPSGALHTFDFHEERVKAARLEFEDHGLSNLVQVKHRDVCSELGFGLEDVADAVFLDLPHPWKAVEHAKKALKKVSGGRICSFSPCIEQVQKTALFMKENGFIEILTMEVLLREFQVRKITLQKYDKDFGLEDSSPVEEPQNKKHKLENMPSKTESSFITGLPLTSMPGHTGYLTFATLRPR